MSDPNTSDPMTPDSVPFKKEENLLKKGDYIDIRKMIPELQEIVVSMGWDRKLFNEAAIDIDLSCFLINKAGQTSEDSDFIFYNNPKAHAGAIRHQGDSRTGAGDGDDEVINIDLNGLHFDIIKIVFVISVYNAGEREHHLGQIGNLYLRMINMTDNNEIFRFKFNEDEFKGYSGIKVGELVREGPKWYFSALGEPIPGGLAKIATQYGIIVADQ
jgi:tellurium resistance protein TerD